MKITKIIHDDNRIMIIPLLVSWGINKCDVKDCKNYPNAILTFENGFIAGCCEEHYLEGKAGKELSFKFEQQAKVSA